MKSVEIKLIPKYLLNYTYAHYVTTSFTVFGFTIKG